MNSKILGCLAGASVGDAMGAATETKSSRQIRALFGGRVESFCTPPEDVPAKGRRAGQVTDAFSIPYILTEYMIKNDGNVTKKLAEEALIAWGNTEYFEPFAGMTTRKAVSRLSGADRLSNWDRIGHLGNKLFKGHYYALSSNGAGVKAYPMGLLSAGNVERAITDTIESTMASHDDPYSISGACAVAAAVSEAMKEHTSVFAIVQAAIYGSIQGEQRARNREDIWIYPGPSVTKRIEMAVEIAMHAGQKEEIIGELQDRIGSGPAIAETVPTALGILIANQGNMMESIFDGVNIGDETSAVASIAGAIAGAYHGVEDIPEGYVEMIEEENGMNLRKQAEEIEKLWKNIW